MQKMKKIGLLIISILLLSSFLINCYATSVPVTEENLKSALQEFLSSSENEDEFKINNVSDNVITVTAYEDTYTLNYDLTENPKFTMEIPIQQGMSYEDFENKTDSLILPIIGYVAVANIQGVEFEDIASYFVMSYLAGALSGSIYNEDSYDIVDDTVGGIVDKSQSDSKTIYVSEFGERVMEYVNSVLKDKRVITDNMDGGINSYELTLEKKDVTSTSCKLVSELTVNLDADFSKIKEYNSKVEESFLNKNITEYNADYAVKLKVGQKCRFESTDEIIGCSIYGSIDHEKINDNCIEFTATDEGKANGYIYLGETKKSVYFTVEENTENEVLDTIVLKINTGSGLIAGQVQTAQSGTESKDYVTAKGVLPKAGVRNIIYIVIASSVIFLAIFAIKLKQYRDIK